MTASLRNDLLDALGHGSVAVPTWHLAPRDRWHLLRDTLLGHVPLRGGLRTRDLPFDGIGRALVATSEAIQSLEYPVGGTTPCRFGDWLCLYAILVEPAIASCPPEDPAALAALRRCVRELRAVFGLDEKRGYAMSCPFLHRLLAVLGMSRQEWAAAGDRGERFDGEWSQARLGARICAAWRRNPAPATGPAADEVLAWATQAIGSSSRKEAELADLATTRRVVATLKPIDVQAFIHRATTHWMMRGASTWSSQALAFARDRIVGSHDALLLADSDALVAFMLPEGAPPAAEILAGVETDWRDPALFGERFPRLGPLHPGRREEGSPAVDPTVALPRLSLRLSSPTSVLDLCIGRVDAEHADEARIGWRERPEPARIAESLPCSFVEGESTVLSDSPPWLSHDPRNPRNYGWSALCWSLTGTTSRTHWHDGVCAELRRRGDVPAIDAYAMTDVHHGGWLRQIGMAGQRLAFVKLDGDSVGARFLGSPIPGRPLAGLGLARHVQARIVAGTRRVIEVHEASRLPRYLPVDLVYVGGDDVFFCLPESYLEPFLRGFGESRSSDDGGWNSLEFSFVSVALPPGDEFAPVDVDDRDAGRLRADAFARANLAAARSLAPAMRDLAKARRRDDAALDGVNAAIRSLGFRCQWADAPPDLGAIHGFSLRLVSLVQGDRPLA